MSRQTTDPYEETDDCPAGHEWVAGMVIVHPDDMAWIPPDRHVECSRCETEFIADTPATVDNTAGIPANEPSNEPTEDEDEMSLADKISALRSAGFSLGWAETAAGECGYFVPREIEWEARVDHWRVTDAADFGHPYGYEGFTPYVDLGRVARGDDTYGGTPTVDRANFIALQRDYPQVEWRNVHYVNQHSLGAYVSDLPADLIKILAGLADDHPVYDEDTLSEIEHGEIDESWSGFMAYEVKSELSEPARIMWDALGEDAVTSLWWNAVSADAFGNYPEHTGVEVVWGEVKERVAEFRPILINAYLAHRAGNTLPDAYVWIPMILEPIRLQRVVDRYHAAWMADTSILHTLNTWESYLSTRGILITNEGYRYKDR